MPSLALSDGFLCLCAAWLASRAALPTGYRFAVGLLSIAALLGFLRFSGIYPLKPWHRLFSIMGACAALPLLAAGIRWPDSAVATLRQFTLIFLGAAMLLGLVISGLGNLRLYDQAVGLVSMLAMLWWLVTLGNRRRVTGIVLMLTGSLLFVAKVTIGDWLQPGDLLHLGMAFGLILLAPVVPTPAPVETASLSGMAR